MWDYISGYLFIPLGYAISLLFLSLLVGVSDAVITAVCLLLFNNSGIADKFTGSIVPAFNFPFRGFVNKIQSYSTSHFQRCIYCISMSFCRS